MQKQTSKDTIAKGDKCNERRYSKAKIQTQKEQMQKGDKGKRRQLQMNKCRVIQMQ